MKKLWFIPFILAMSVLASCATGADVPASKAVNEKLNVSVSILPQKYIVEQIGGDYIEVNVLAGPGADPHTYEPKPEQMKSLARSRLYFAIGVDFEQAWLERFEGANPEMKVVNTIEGLQLLPMTTNEQAGDTSTEENHDNEIDTHTWTSPEMVKHQAAIITQALSEVDPNHAAEYQQNYDAFLAELTSLQADIHQTLEGIGSKKFLVFHPAWGYFAQEFGLEQVAVEVGGQEPSAQELAEIIKEAQTEDIRVVFAQPEISTRSAEIIANEINGKVLLISPLEENWMENMRKVAQTFKDVLK